MKELIEASIGLVSQLILLVAGLALLAFLWGLMKFIFRVGGDAEAVKDGKRLMVWGLIALFVMTSVWGIIRFVQKDLLGSCGGTLVDSDVSNENRLLPFVCPEISVPVRQAPNPQIPNTERVEPESSARIAICE